MKTKVKSKIDNKLSEQSTVDSGIQLVKTGSGPNLAGKGRVGFAIGKSSQGKLFVRIVSNSGSGSFADDWVALDGIWQEMDRNSPNDGPVTSGDMMKCYVGKSQNSAGFALAALKAEGFVVISRQKRRCYDRVDAATYDAKCKALLEGKAAKGTSTKKTGGRPAAGRATKRAAKETRKPKVA